MPYQSAKAAAAVAFDRHGGDTMIDVHASVVGTHQSTETRVGITLCSQCAGRGTVEKAKLERFALAQQPAHVDRGGRRLLRGRACTGFFAAVLKILLDICMDYCVQYDVTIRQTRIIGGHIT